MPDSSRIENDFLNSLKELILENLSNDKFGVSELADTVGMSRSNLLRRIQKHTSLSASQFIRQVRLEAGMDRLKVGASNVSEIAFEVGFSSVSYFIKCFREQYGYPPGEVGRQKEELAEEKCIDVTAYSSKAASTIQNPVDSSAVLTSPATNTDDFPNRKLRKFIWLVIAVVVVLVTYALYLYGCFNQPSAKELSADHISNQHSIAVLPFINDSNDSTNVYIINGLMESILNNLQKIEGLKVISRTSVEKYRKSSKTVPEIAKELNVAYILEGSGQKVGNKILLNIQLIEAHGDDHLWAEQYNREVNDIFQLQIEVAQKIAGEIEVIITPAEEERIKQKPTDNLVAYDFFLKGIDYLNQETTEGLQAGIPWLLKAIEEDEEFAAAYAALGLAYYYLDYYKAEKKYLKELNYYADKALLYNPKLAHGLTAKAFYYQSVGDFKQAVIYLEKALEYNPNSDLVINMLSDLYTNHIPHTGKYLEYALRGVSLDIASKDSSTASYIYLHLGNALVQSGFVNEALHAVDQSLEYNPDNLFSVYVRAYILYARDRDLLKTKQLLLDALERDTTRIDIIQEVGNVCYYLRDYENAYKYFRKLTELRKKLNLSIFEHKNAEISFVFGKLGYTEESAHYLQQFKQLAEQDTSIYAHMNMGFYMAYQGETEKALEHFQLFAEEDNYMYWILLFLEMDPLLDGVKEHSEFIEAMDKMKQKFWEKHKEIRVTLEEKQLLRSW